MRLWLNRIGRAGVVAVATLAAVLAFGGAELFAATPEVIAPDISTLFDYTTSITNVTKEVIAFIAAAMIGVMAVAALVALMSWFFGRRRVGFKG